MDCRPLTVDCLHSSAADQSQENSDYRNNEKNMDDAANTEYKGTQEPSYNKDDGNDV